MYYDWTMKRQYALSNDEPTLKAEYVNYNYIRYTLFIYYKQLRFRKSIMDIGPKIGNRFLLDILNLL